MFKCPKCGYDESAELMKKYVRPSEHEQCHRCEWWVCANELGSYCNKPQMTLKVNIDSNCQYFRRRETIRYYRCPDCQGEFVQPPEGYKGQCKACKAKSNGYAP